MPGYISNQGYLNFDANTGVSLGGKINIYDYQETVGVKQTTIFTPNSLASGKIDKRTVFLYLLKNQIAR